jgi:sugar-specific transcriptional regulator TrmB
MSLERIIEALVHLGLPRLDAKVYVTIAKNGPQKAMDLTEILNINKKKTYICLKNLKSKGLVIKFRPMFSAISFEDVLDLLIRKEKELADSLQESEKELLATWKKEE